ncbi:MAG: radical SAM protein [Maritimibacter sp.]
MKHRNAANINLAIGRSCFVQCSGCYNQFAKSEDLISNNEILNFLSHARDRGIESVTYCGGDPLSRPHIIELLLETKRLGLFVKLDTVGTPFLGDATTIFFGRNHVKGIDVAEVAAIIDRIGIPIDGSTEETITVFRTGRKEFLTEQVKILELLAEHDCNINVNTVVTQKNASDLIEIGNLIHNISDGIGWEMFQFSPSGPISFKQRAGFEINTSTFRKRAIAAQAHMAELNHKGRVSALANVDRRDLYVLVDSDGEAWRPVTAPFLDGDTIFKPPAKEVLGNIRDVENYDFIISMALSPCHTAGERPRERQSLRSATLH